jgi:hypothetical protein
MTVAAFRGHMHIKSPLNIEVLETVASLAFWDCGRLAHMVLSPNWFRSR